MSFAEALVVSLLVGLLLLGLVVLWRVAPARQAFNASAMMAEWDRRVRDMPQHADLRSISDRLATVERVCDVVRAEMSGMKDAVGRVERMTNMLLQQHLDVASKDALRAKAN